MELFIALILAALFGLVCYIVRTEQDGCDCSLARARQAARQTPRQETAPLIVEQPVLPSEAVLMPQPHAQPAAAAIASVEAAPVDAVAAVEMAPAYTAPIIAMPSAVDESSTEASPVPELASAVATSHAAAGTLLRNPLTGEAVAIPNNYRFAKKWIKEALVAEGLLDKIYKNNELDAAASKKVKAALTQFKSLGKYHA